MFRSCKGKSNKNLRWAFVPGLVILTFFSLAHSATFNFQNSLPKVIVDSPPPQKLWPRANDQLRIVNTRDTPPPVRPFTDSIKIKDTTYRVTDTISFKTSKEALTEPVVYHADDSMVVDVPDEKMYLYGKVSSIQYGENDLSAPIIQYDQKTNLVKAYLQKDSAGKVISYVSYNQGDFKSVMDSITLNMRTQKGITKGTYTQQGEMFVYGERIKKVNDSVFYALNSRFTTCNLDTPHFAFVSKRIKFINDKVAFSGPVHPEFEGVPVPIILPFGIYPLQKGKHSGILSPNFTTNSAYGIGLDNFGYYKIVNDNWDFVTRGSIFSYGGWSGSFSPRYFSRYRYQGNLAFNVLNTKLIDEKGNRTYNFTWVHTMDPKARPGVTFRANVNAGSSTYNTLLPNSPQTNFQNTVGSTIAYEKTFKNKPYNFRLQASHDQNSVTRVINVTLPEGNFNLNTQYPFRKKERIGDIKWYENLGIGLNSNVKSLTTFFDTANVIKQAQQNLQYGATHSVPISLSLPPLGVMQVAPSVSYQESWYQRKILQKWNSNTKRIDTSTSNGFYTARQMSFGVGLSTRIFGLFSFREASRIKAIRHEIRPSISINYQPDFAKGAYRNVQIDSLGTTIPYNVYSTNTIGQAFGRGEFGGLSFNIDNNISMKIKDRKDTSANATKKISLIDGFQLSGSYNFLQDSFRLSNLSLRLFTTLFQKINITGSADLDPYQVSPAGRRIDKLLLQKSPYALGSLTNANITLSSSFRGGSGSSNKGQLASRDLYRNSTSQQNNMGLDEFQQEALYIQQNPGEFADFSIPWSVDFDYNFSVSRARIPGTTKLTTTTSQGFGLTPSVSLTKKWKVGGQTRYNITQKTLGDLSMFLSRDMHCWQMAINIAPAGRYRYFSINISPKSTILKDLKVNRTRSFNNF